MDNLVKQLLSLSDIKFTILSIIVAVITILLPIIIYSYLSRKSLSKSVLLVGLSDAGKTVLFSQLIGNRFVSSVTSMKETESLLKTRNRKSINLIDLPGFERLRMKFWDDFKLRAKAVVFVVDGTDFVNNIRDVADLLYNYLVDDFVISKRIPFLVTVTKQDETRAKSAKVVQKQLEREINAIRETRFGALSSTGDDNTRAILGKIDKEFSFNDLKNPIEFVECSAAEDNTQLESVLNWLEIVA